MCYVFGLVTLNIHLSRFGYHSLGFLELDYIIAGLWSLAPLVMAALLVFTVFFIFASPWLFNEPPRNHDWTYYVINLLAGIIIWGLVIGTLFWLSGLSFSWSWLIAGIIEFCIGANLMLLPVGFSLEKDLKNRILLAVMIIWGIIGLPFFLIYFASQVYPTIPDVLGGGAGNEVVLIAKDSDAKAAMQALGIQFTQENKSEPVKLIWAAEKELIIAPADQSIKAVKLNADQVVAVIYQK